MTAISAVMFVVILLVWIAGLMRTQVLSQWGMSGRDVFVEADFWRFDVFIQRPVGGRPPPLPYGTQLSVIFAYRDIAFDVCGFLFWMGRSQGAAVGYLNTTVIGLPALPLCCVTAILPVVQFVKWFRRKRRIDPRVCRQCGYDLRASRNRCPECGLEIPVAAR